MDDERNILRSFTRQFFNDGFTVVTACGAAQGLEYISSRHFPLVISDYRMPGMNGIEFLREVRRTSPESIRIIITGYADTAVAVSAINEGHIYKFLTKPWDEEQLRVHIKRAFEYYELRKEGRLLHEELVKKNKELEEVNNNLKYIVEERTQQLLHSEKLATLGQIAGQIGHEINNSITILMGRMQLLRRADFDPEYVRKTMNIYAKEIDRLGSYAGNLLSFGRPVQPQFRIIDAKDALEGTIENLRSSGVLKYYTISREYGVEEAMIYGDHSQLDQVFTNLFVNAHHAMDGTGVLTVRMRTSDDAKFVETTIEDTGSGIPPDIIEKVFDPFFTTKPEGKGTGLGLSVVKQIVASHHGYIHIRSEGSRGTAVTVGLPLRSVKTG